MRTNIEVFIPQNPREELWTLWTHVLLPTMSGFRIRDQPPPSPGRESVDYSQLARKQHLKPVEVNLRIMEDVVRGPTGGGGVPPPPDLRSPPYMRVRG